MSQEIIPTSDNTDTLADARDAKDIRMLRMAVRRGWGVKPQTKDRLVARMDEVMEKRTVNVPVVVDGMAVDVPREDIADRNAIAAAAIILDCDKTDQKDFEREDKNARLDAGLLTERAGIEPVILKQYIPEAE